MMKGTVGGLSENPGKKPHTRRIWLVMFLAFLAACASAAGVPWLISMRSPSAPVENSVTADGTRTNAQDHGSASERRAVVCAAPPAGRMDNGHCARISADLIRRTGLTPRQQQVAAQLAPAVDRAASSSRESRTECDSATAVCRRVASAAEVGEVRRSLAAAGFTDAVVRTARPDDPAPAGAVVYAVGSGPACVLGYLSPNSTGVGSTQIGGRLPDGTCLTR
ncbi:hypothetical protein EV385_0195 [Krasilnikovia cinnamomea]|uniref:Uncharacterized protein n=1 Tax=Krasilnikovia cinnamomea TaxID=349313 RepID=A0A4Q7ZET5_9ACTN|nr:hypothetical protein [Krasilnikovia cinnamomea]RZU48479.1 hypothetical protein EV385_0195 [Krasilnikovia cinnamomea]